MFNNTKKLALAAALSLAAFSANATIINFADMGNNPAPPNPDQGGYQPLVIHAADNLDITINGYNANGSAFAYLDSKTGGLGVCGVLDKNLQCNPSNDDNVEPGESLTFDFTDHSTGAPRLTGINSISFNNNHDGGFWKGDKIDINGMPVDVSTPAGAHVTHTVLDPFSGTAVSSFTVAYNNVQFYVDQIDVPEPSIIALLGLGLIGVGAFSRKSVKRS